jgi:hypothetical protein
MKSSWSSPDGGSSVAPNTKLESPLRLFSALGGVPLRRLSGVFIQSRKKNSAKFVVAREPASTPLRGIGVGL